MSTSDVRLGLTNILKRLAYHHLCQGFGRRPIQHDMYDEVEVSELYPWSPNEDGTEYGGGVRVTFYRDKLRVRWIEFGIRYGGGGGDLSVYSVKPVED